VEIKKAAIILQKPEQWLRLFLQNVENNPIGIAYKVSGSSRYDYYIEDFQLRKYVGEEKWLQGIKKWKENEKDVKN